MTLSALFAMPYLISTSFDRFLEKITIGGDLRSIATTRGAKIGELLRDAFRGPQIIPTGSLLRGTGLKGASDLDVMAVLHYGDYVKNKTPMRLLEDVREVLSDYDAKIVKKNGQAVTLYFTTWPNVDIVPAIRINGYADLFHIPDTNTGNWIATSPATHDRAMAAVPIRRRQLVRMMKRWNASHSGYFESFHIEQVALHTSAAHDGNPWGEDSWPWAINQFFENAIALTGPREPMSIPYSLDDWTELRGRLARAKQQALDAWHAIYSKNDVAAAVDRYRVMFGDAFPAYG